MKNTVKENTVKENTVEENTVEENTVKESVEPIWEIPYGTGINDYGDTPDIYPDGFDAELDAELDAMGISRYEKKKKEDTVNPVQSDEEYEKKIENGRKTHMKDLLLTIREMNKEPLQQHAKKLLLQAKKEVDDYEALYLMQAATLIKEDPEFRKEAENSLSFKIYRQLMQKVDDLIPLSPKAQMWWLTRKEGEAGNPEELMETETLEDLMLWLANNLLYRIDEMNYEYD